MSLELLKQYIYNQAPLHTGLVQKPIIVHPKKPGQEPFTREQWVRDNEIDDPLDLLNTPERNLASLLYDMEFDIQNLYRKKATLADDQQEYIDKIIEDRHKKIAHIEDIKKIRLNKFIDSLDNTPYDDLYILQKQIKKERDNLKNIFDEITYLYNLNEADFHVALAKGDRRVIKKLREKLEENRKGLYIANHSIQFLEHKLNAINNKLQLIKPKDTIIDQFSSFIETSNHIQRNITTQSVSDVTELGGGINIAKKIQLEDGTYVVFKPSIGETLEVRTDIPGNYFLREVAAYEAAVFLGMSSVPITTIKSIEGETGSAQEFIEDADIFSSVKYPYSKYRDSIREALIFDTIICNTDRHRGNALIKDDRLILIDHGLSFPDNIYSDEFYSCFTDYIPYNERTLNINEKSKLQGFLDNKDTIIKRLSPILGQKEIAAMFFRVEDMLLNNIIPSII